MDRTCRGPLGGQSHLAPQPPVASARSHVLHRHTPHARKRLRLSETRHSNRSLENVSRIRDPGQPGNDPYPLRTDCTKQARPVRGARAARTASAVSYTLLSMVWGSVSHPLAKMESA